MTDIRVYHVDAFTTEKFGGNAAGVVLDGEFLTEDDMQSIAKELNLPESVFLPMIKKPIIASNTSPRRKRSIFAGMRLLD